MVLLTLPAATPSSVLVSQLHTAHQLPPVDFAVSYSSIEHSGLTRYGDAPNPHGDMEALAQIWCWMKPQATLFVGFPVDFSHDGILWPLHRVYGRKRLRHLLANFECFDAHPEALFTQAGPKPAPRLTAPQGTLVCRPLPAV